MRLWQNVIIAWHSREHRPVWTHNTLFLLNSSHFSRCQKTANLSTKFREEVQKLIERTVNPWCECVVTRKELQMGRFLEVIIRFLEEMWCHGNAINWGLCKPQNPSPILPLHHIYLLLPISRRNLALAIFRRLSGEAPASFSGKQKVSKCPKFDIHFRGVFIIPFLRLIMLYVSLSTVCVNTPNMS